MRIQTNSTAYNFTYGPFSQRTGVSVGTQTLATYEYTGDRNRYLQKMTYGNNDFVQYTYDSQGRVICETYEDGTTLTYAYDTTGTLGTPTDTITYTYGDSDWGDPLTTYNYEDTKLAKSQKGRHRFGACLYSAIAISNRYGSRFPVWTYSSHD